MTASNGILHQLAVHECGHFIVARALGYEVAEPRISLDSAVSLGSCALIDDIEEASNAHVVMIAIAGHIAEAIAFKLDPAVHVAESLEY